MTRASFQIVSENVEQTAAVGAALAAWLGNGDVLLLHGDLGAGKTTLTKGIAHALGVDSVVSSPSFSLINEYDTGLNARVKHLYHLDLFRLQDDDDLASIGFADFARPTDGVTIVEWPERATAMLPERYLVIEIELRDTDNRILCFAPVPNDDQWRNRLESLRSLIEASDA